MTQCFSKFGLAVAMLLIGLSPIFGQQDLDLINKPKTVPEFWRAVKFEVSQGKYDLAAEFLKGLLALNPTEKDLLAIEDREGIASILALRNVQKWSDNPKLQTEAKQNVEAIIGAASNAVKKLRTDPERIAKFIKNLSASPEEREYAIVELRKSGTTIMPAFIAALVAADLEERQQLLSVLPLLDADTVPAVLATFDVNNPAMRLDLMSVIARRTDLLKLLGRTETDPRPTLWYLAAKQDLVGLRARDMLASLTGTPVNKLPSSTSELLNAAEIAYQHKTTFSSGTDAPPVWRWDGKKLTSSKLPVSQAEEFYGLRYSRWALELEPNDEAAQVEFLSIATEKAAQRFGLEKKLSAAAPAVYEMLSLAPANVLYTMVERALAENHLSVAIGAIQVIGDRAEAKGFKAKPAPAPRNMDAIRSAPDPLVKALNSKDRRLALAAADALTRIPGTPPHQVMARVVEVYRSLLANPAEDTAMGNASRPRALVADADGTRAEVTGSVLRQAGFDTAITRTGRDTLKRLNQAADIDIIWINDEIPYPELPYLLAQIRGDVKYGNLPIFITISEDISKAVLPEMDVRIDHLVRTQPEIKVTEKSPVRITLSFDGMKVKQSALEEWLGKLRVEKPTVRATTEATLLIKLLMDKTRESEQELKKRVAEMALDLPEVRVTQESAVRVTFTLDGLKPTPEEFENRIARLQRDFPSLTVTRELPTNIHLTNGDSNNAPLHVAARVARLAEKYQHIGVVSRPVTAEDVREDILACADDPAAQALTGAERKEYQLRAIEGLRRLATGEVPGYDVRPAAQAIRSALHSDELAGPAIDAVVRLPGKEVQQDLVDLVLNPNRLVPLRVKAAAGLLQHMQVHGSAPLTDTQIQSLLKLFDTAQVPEVRAAVAPVLGAIPKDRVLRNLPDQATRDNWLNRMRKYEPTAPADSAPAPAPKHAEK